MEIIRMELNVPMETFQAAVAFHHEDIKKMMMQKLDEIAYDPEQQKCVTKAVGECFDMALKEAIGDYFRYGEGRVAVSKAVENSMKEIFANYGDKK